MERFLAEAKSGRMRMPEKREADFLPAEVFLQSQSLSGRIFSIQHGVHSFRDFAQTERLLD